LGEVVEGRGVERKRVRVKATANRAGRRGDDEAGEHTGDTYLFERTDDEMMVLGATLR
jgi:hypothetical protein